MESYEYLREDCEVEDFDNSNNNYSRMDSIIEDTRDALYDALNYD